MNEKISEIRRLQTELNRREDEGADDIENLKSSITTLEKENASLKVGIMCFRRCMLFDKFPYPLPKKIIFLLSLYWILNDSNGYLV